MQGITISDERHKKEKKARKTGKLERKLRKYF